MIPADEPERRPDVRVGDRDREQAVAHLGEAFAEGRLDLSEYDERVASAYSAKTASDLLHLTADLPLATRDSGRGPARAASDTVLPGPRQRPARPSRPSVAAVTSDLPGPLRGVWWAYATAVSVNLVIWLIVSVTTGELTYFWPIWVAGPWGVVLLLSTLAHRSGPGSRRS